MSGSVNGIPIILHHTDDATHTPDPLYAGETAWCVAPTVTKVWVGEGPPTNVNRLLLSTNSADNPLLNLGSYLPLAGGTLNTVTDTSGGIVIPVDDSSWARPGIRINVDDGWGFVVASGPGAAIGNFICGGSDGLEITNNLTNPLGAGISIRNSTGNTGLQVTSAGSNANTSIRAAVASLGQAMVLHTTTVAMAGGEGDWLVMQRYLASGTTVVGNNQRLGNILFQGRANALANSPPLSSAELVVSATQAWTATSAGTRWVFRTTPNNTTTMQDALIIDQDRRVSVWNGTAMVQLPGAGGIAEPTTAGNYLRSMNGSGSWVAGLPLSGGTLSNQLTITTPPPGLAEYTFFAQQAPPVTTTTTQYVGLRFSVSTPGNILAIWVCKSPDLVGGSKQFVIGVLPATGGSFTTPTVWNVTLAAGAGWQRVELATPFPVTPGTNYAIRISDTNPHVTTNGLASPLTVGPLTAISAISGTTNALDLNNYWLDVVFEGAAPAPVALSVGVPTGPAVIGVGNVNVQGGYYVNGVPLANIPEPTTAGNFLRTNTRTWVPGLPLAGGMMNAGAEIQWDNRGPGTRALWIRQGPATGPGLQIDSNDSANPVFSVLRVNPDTSPRFYVRGDGSIYAIVDDTGSDPLSIGQNASGAGAVFLPRLRVVTNGAVLVGNPSGPAVTGSGNLNIQGGYFVNGVRIEVGDPDSGGPGYRMLRMAN